MSLRVIATFVLLPIYFYQHNVHNFDKLIAHLTKYGTMRTTLSQHKSIHPEKKIYQNFAADTKSSTAHPSKRSEGGVHYSVLTSTAGSGNHSEKVKGSCPLSKNPAS